MRLAFGKSLMIVTLAILGAAMAFLLVAIPRMHLVGEEYRQCYERSLRHFDFSFDACRLTTEGVNRDMGIAP